MILGRDAIQVVTTAVYSLTLIVIAVRLFRNRSSWLVFVPLAINVVLTIAFYVVDFLLPAGIIRFGDWSAVLRLETGLTILFYAFYLPFGRMP